ncbi:M48 family metalloprotease [Candidatus Finniella inopinata]|nr:M48 family metalloprotease [Candidatus Finniella inopinata]
MIKKSKKPLGAGLRKFFTLLFACLFLCLSTAQTGDIPKDQFISDEEIEQTLTDWLSQIFKVANVSMKPKVLILSSPEVNAGATLGGMIIVYTGLILKCQNVNQLLGVLAHETGHIAGAHSARAAEAQNQALVPAVATMLLSGAAALAAGSPDLLAAGLAGGAQVFERGLLKHSRDQEETADASALRYLTALGWPTRGLGEFLHLLDTNYTGPTDPYTLTHPLSNERREKVSLFERQALVNVQTLPKEEGKFQRIKGKINGFMNKPDAVLREYKSTDKSIAARYARSIALYRKGRHSEALAVLQGLIDEHPSDPFFLELKGQIYFETGKISEAASYFRQALKLLPKAQTISMLLAQALLESQIPDSKILDEAVSLLMEVVDHAPENVFAWRLLAKAYGRKNQMDHMALCLAEEAFLFNNVPMAKSQAQKASKSKDPIVAKRAKDILGQIEPAGA